MKQILFILLIAASLNAYGQDKYNYVHFNKLTEVVGTEYVIASNEYWGKMLETQGKYLLFINTKTGNTNQIDFPTDAKIAALEQIKLDSLGINLILLAARTVDLDNKNSINWGDPTQIIVVSPDGKTKTQLTDDNFFVAVWAINRWAGTLVVTGHYDSNNNKKQDKTDKSEIHIYDLKTLKLTKKI
jgi:hypothetical protein